MTNTSTDPELAGSLLYCLNKWRQGTPIHLRDIPSNYRITIQQQHELGWQSLLEGLPTKQWQIQQLQYYKRRKLRKSSRRWIKGLLLKLHYLSWNQWDHRNRIKHDTIQPEKLRALEILDREIMAQHAKGTADLQIGDRAHLEENLIVLLQRQPNYKKHWLANVLASRQRSERIRRNDNEYSDLSPEALFLQRWMKGYDKDEAEEVELS